jgi:hypothetical protein
VLLLFFYSVPGYTVKKLLGAWTSDLNMYRRVTVASIRHHTDQCDVKYCLSRTGWMCQLWPNTVTGVVHWHEKKLDNFPEEEPLKVTWILHMLLNMMPSLWMSVPIYSCLKILTEFTISGPGQNFYVDYIIFADHCLSTA